MATTDGLHELGVLPLNTSENMAGSSTNSENSPLEIMDPLHHLPETPPSSTNSKSDQGKKLSLLRNIGLFGIST